MTLPAFLPPRLWQVHGDEGEPRLEWRHRPAGLMGKWQAQWVIDRAFCIFRSLDLRHVPRNERQQALELKLAVLSPFRQSGQYVVWKDGIAQIWLWDQQLCDQAEQTLTELSANYRRIPETLMQPPLSSEDDKPHVRLVSQRQGYDLQVWQQGVLLLSHCYPAMPAVEQYQHLLRGVHGLEMPGALSAESVATLPKPWATSAAISAIGEWERWTPYALSALLLMGTVFNIGQGLTWWWSGKDIRAESQTLAAEIEPILSARGKAISATQKAAALQQIYTDKPRQMPMLNEVADLLPNDTQLEIWRFRDDQLELRIKTNRSDPRFFVQKFQDTGRFSNVKVEPMASGDGLLLHMTVL